MTTPSKHSPLLTSRARLPRPDGSLRGLAQEQAAEGGCGVIGFASTEQVAGRHLLQALDQMRNRGNGKGGGAALVGLAPEQFGVTQQVLDEDYLIAVAYLDESSRPQVEADFIEPVFEVDHIFEQPQLANWRTLPRLEVPPPNVVIYFVRVRPNIANKFAKDNNLLDISQKELEDELVYQNTYRLNHRFYAAQGETRAFVLSHGKNLLVLKMVGYGDDVLRYYRLEDVRAHVWIGHHRYPTKGRVWHPGGAHPFIGMNEALVHNGDFANYASIAEYLQQRNIHQLYLTDTEVSVQVFDLLYRTYGYPLEYVIEAIAPTTERDFTLLPPEKQRIYRMLQTTHMHCSPDGPWFFLIAQSESGDAPGAANASGAGTAVPVHRLTCITDTSMLRPQVFALQRAGQGGPAIGFAASEKQAIDAALQSLSAEDRRFWPRADRYWNARGGSHTDGGAFIFSVERGADVPHFRCTDKFGREVSVDMSAPPFRQGPAASQPVPVAAGAGPLPAAGSNGGARLAASAQPLQAPASLPNTNGAFLPALRGKNAAEVYGWFTANLPEWSYDQAVSALEALVETAADPGRTRAFKVLSLLMDRRYPTGRLRRSSLLALVDRALALLVAAIRETPSPGYVAAGQEKGYPGATVVLDARGFDPEGPDSLALELVRLGKTGFQRMIVTHCTGHRFIGNGFGPESEGVRIDVFGSPGDYLASGLDGMAIHVHNNAQDQLAQIMKRGELVVYGDVGQTFMYGAKGGQAYVLGNAAGRPLINAVGKPRVVINGTALDYLAESFMAGDPHNGGGFVILNGVHLNDQGAIEDLPSPYPGGNLFSLASGGAIFVRDPHHRVTRDQLNGGEFFPFEARDWDLIRSMLAENERLFGIQVDGLLSVDGEIRSPQAVYRKIGPAAVRALQAEEAWIGKH
jgi:glutamate synthase domain-containing protein 1/glutamate synthase domain-containing protein 3